ncbi:hypothetical protein LW135_05390 [Helicobacter sp. faydin-H20]|uniref:hypothetical protein n=1 Tax=Helicobacter anatolicus TaxID=2905874 RepID=UPI001E582C38|nr:hypothetical protein [Helicobacter anatolicus]MCE3037263.1 hypothetical protein [Helicobacter anatolicus]
MKKILFLMVFSIVFAQDTKEEECEKYPTEEIKGGFLQSLQPKGCKNEKEEEVLKNQEIDALKKYLEK